jgi:hypothetical protein
MPFPKAPILFERDACLLLLARGARHKFLAALFESALKSAFEVE